MLWEGDPQSPLDTDAYFKERLRIYADVRAFRYPDTAGRKSSADFYRELSLCEEGELYEGLKTYDPQLKTLKQVLQESVEYNNSRFGIGKVTVRLDSTVNPGTLHQQGPGHYPDGSSANWGYRKDILFAGVFIKKN